MYGIYVFVTAFFFAPFNSCEVKTSVGWTADAKSFLSWAGGVLESVRDYTSTWGQWDTQHTSHSKGNCKLSRLHSLMPTGCSVVSSLFYSSSKTWYSLHFYFSLHSFCSWMSVRSKIESDNEVHGSCDVRYLWFSLCSKYIHFCIWTAEIERSQDTVSAGFSLEFWLLEFFIELNWNWLVTLKFTSVDHKPVGSCQMCEVRKLNWTENLQMVLVPDGKCNTITFYYIFASYCIQQRWYFV